MGLIKDFWEMKIVQEIMNHVHCYNIYIDAVYLKDKTIEILLCYCHPFDREHYRSMLTDAGVLPKERKMFRKIGEDDYV